MVLLGFIFSNLLLCVKLCFRIVLEFFFLFLITLLFFTSVEIYREQCLWLNQLYHSLTIEIYSTWWHYLILKKNLSADAWKTLPLDIVVLVSSLDLAQEKRLHRLSLTTKTKLTCKIPDPERSDVTKYIINHNFLKLKHTET